MSAQAITWLPLEEIKRELRIHPGVNDEDGMLARQVGAAVSYVETETGLPLLNKTETRRVAHTGVNLRELFLGYVPFLLRVTRVAYWTDPDAQSPDELIPNPEDLRRIEGIGTNPQSWNKLWYLEGPSGGWPISANSLYEVTIEYGMTPTEHPDVTQALVLIVRDYYQGGQNNLTIFSKQSYDRILEPLYLKGMKDYAPYVDN